MKDLHTVPNENLEARITAWVLGEASSFEAAELEVICAADPKLQLFLSRTKAIHSLMLETPPSSSDHLWKLSSPKRKKLDPIIGPNNSSRAIENSLIPRTIYRTIFGIAAILAVTLFIKHFIFSPTQEPTLTMASASSESNSEMRATSKMSIDSLNEDLADRKASDILYESASVADLVDEKDEAIFEFERKKPDDTLAAKPPESHRILNIGQTFEGGSSDQPSQVMPKQVVMGGAISREKRELLSSHSTVAKFIGIKDHECLGKTASCPDRCGHSGKIATFEIIEYLDYQKTGEYGDPKQTSFQVLIRDNLGKAKIPAEILSIIESLKPNNKVKLSWNHDYVSTEKSSTSERPITHIEAEQ